MAYKVKNNGSGYQNLAQGRDLGCEPNGTAWAPCRGCTAADFSIDGGAAGATYNDTVRLHDLAPGATVTGTITLQMVDSGSNPRTAARARPFRCTSARASHDTRGGAGRFTPVPHHRSTNPFRTGLLRRNTTPAARSITWDDPIPDCNRKRHALYGVVLFGALPAVAAAGSGIGAARAAQGRRRRRPCLDDETQGHAVKRNQGQTVTFTAKVKFGAHPHPREHRSCSGRRREGRHCGRDDSERRRDLLDEHARGRSCTS